MYDPFQQYRYYYGDGSSSLNSTFSQWSREQYAKHFADYAVQARRRQEQSVAQKAAIARQQRAAIEAQRERLLSMATYPDLLRETFEAHDIAQIPARRLEDLE